MNSVNLIGTVKSFSVNHISETRHVVMFTLVVDDGWNDPEKFVDVPCESWGQNKANYFKQCIRINDKISLSGKLKRDKLGNLVIAAQEVNLVARACDLNIEK